VRIKRIQAPIIAGLLLLTLILPQLALAAPEILNVVVLDQTTTTAIIFWTTNTTSDSRVNYGTTTPPAETEYNSSTTTTHFITLTGLTPNTTYYFEVESTDVSGTATDNNSGAYYEFTTLPVSEYSITLDHACGVCGELIEPGICGELIEATAIVAAAGTYHVCWDSRTQANIVGTFTATAAGSRTLVFYVPEAKKGIHNVYLTNNFFDDLAGTGDVAEFEIFPSVKLSSDTPPPYAPNEGPVGTEVTLNGYGFLANKNESEFQFKFNDMVINPSDDFTGSDAKGSWTASFTIPATPSGSYTFCVAAKEGTVFVCWVNKDFTVTPKITANPNLGTAGQTIEINGTGFFSEEEDIEVTFDGKVVKKNIYADEDGSWSSVIAVPPLQSDRYMIDASGEQTRARDVPDVEFTLGAGVSVEPNPAYVGDTITVVGGGFEPGETGIQLNFDGQLEAAGITADTDGFWESSFVLPASTYGSHTVSASGDITKPAVTTTLNVKAKIETLSSVEGAPGDRVTITGSGFSGNQELTVTVGGVEVTENLQTQSNGNIVISFRVPKGVTVGKQTLGVKDEGGADVSADFTVREKVLTPPLLISPKDSKLRSGEVTFHWQGITNGNGFTYTYNLEISGTSGFGNAWSISSIAENSYTLARENEEDLAEGTHYWRAKVVDNYGNESPWSDSNSFIVSPIPIWVWVVVGVVVLVVLMVVAYRETKFKVTENKFDH
jgi:hypothetical protein